MIPILILAILVILLFVGCYIAFNYRVWRKQIKLPYFIMRIFAGRHEINNYERDYCRAHAVFTKLNHKKEEIITPDGARLVGHILVPEKSNGKLIVACHGARSSGLGEFVFSGKRFYDEGYTLIMPDHRGCGESDGEFLGYGTHESKDTYLWVDYAKEHFPELDIYLLGVSMGGATVLMMSPKAKEAGIKAIVADCAYTTIWDAFSYHLRKDCHIPEFPVLYISDMFCRIFAGYAFKEAAPVEYVKKASVPVLFIHGSADALVPCRMTRELYDACISEKKMLTIEGAEHARAYYTSPDEYFNAVEEHFGGVK